MQTPNQSSDEIAAVPTVPNPCPSTQRWLLPIGIAAEEATIGRVLDKYSSVIVIVRDEAQTTMIAMPDYEPVICSFTSTLRHCPQLDAAASPFPASLSVAKVHPVGANIKPYEMWYDTNRGDLATRNQAPGKALHSPIALG
ncbi:hypothetical protein Hypma_001270 [Hypsizygus marmoreus]|uniref:Uncharacterized protein n=1 Tax=Hypsizygus marmoreus TaxID=39966 RepID=A0A369JE27_HYPMA|nr:hypothetical protein Hypma_001270 [Hypsizygus marmoreus]